MHVLHRPHRPYRTALAAVAAAVLAIVLNLAITGSLNDLSSAPVPAGAPTPHGAVHASAISSIGSQTRHPFALSPFTRPFAAPWRLPWTSAAR